MTVRQAEAFWITACEHGEIRPAELPPLADGEVLVRALYSGISRGTECLVFQGRVPGSQHQAMRGPRQEGRFPWPVKYGYCMVGRVEEGPAAILGSTVFCLHPHQTRFVVPANEAVQLPNGLPAERAVLAANMETAVNGLWDSAARLGDRVAVIGAGTVGCLVAYLASRHAGCRVQLIDRDPARARTAAALSLDFALPSEAADGCDLIFHSSGDPQGLATALTLAAMEATIVEMSWFGDRTVPLTLGESFHSKRLTIRSSQVSRIPADQAPRWQHRRRLALALDLLRDDGLDCLITGESAFRDLPATMAELCREPKGVLCHRIRYQE